MVISEQWSLYREDDVGKAQFVKEKILNDVWWDKINYIISFTNPIYEMLRVADIDKPCRHLVYDMRDSMIKKVKHAIYREEKTDAHEKSIFYDGVYNILIARWTKSNTPLHCMAHSLNPKYYSREWLEGAPNRVAPHNDPKIAKERKECIQRFFPNAEERRLVNVEFGKLANEMDGFVDPDSMRDRRIIKPKLWWVVYGDEAPTLQCLALKLLGQPYLSSCSERNWSTYSFINLVIRNKMNPQCADDLVFVHNNLRLLSKRSSDYHEGENKMWDVGRWRCL